MIFASDQFATSRCDPKSRAKSDVPLRAVPRMKKGFFNRRAQKDGKVVATFTSALRFQLLLIEKFSVNQRAKTRCLISLWSDNRPIIVASNGFIHSMD